jgi:LysM repeat protein
MNTPSPLVPQGAIPPKTTSRPQRVLMIAAMVVGLHVAGLSLVLFQGCGKDSGVKTAGNTPTDTNTTAMSYPAPDTNPAPSLFASASNSPAASLAHANTNLTPTPGVGSPIGGPLPGVPANASGLIADAGLPVPPAPVDQTAAVPAGPEKDYKVQKGDTLTSIASKNGITVGALMKSNPNLDPKKLKVGQPLKVPAPVAPTPKAVAGTASVPPTSSGATANTATPASAAGTYKVKPGDTLTKIAKAHGITVNQLRAANNMKTTQVQVGKVLKIPAPQKTAAVPTTTNTTQH